MLRTWDIFDTLIARKCVFPHIVFQIVEQISEINGFANIRRNAEVLTANTISNYKLNDIYDVMVQQFNVPTQLAEQLKKLEVDVEIDQTIPIAENLNQVKSGDVLISDMYLPENIIRQMLEKAGLFVPVELVITSGGKRGGGYGNKLRIKMNTCFIQAIIGNQMLKIQENMALIPHGQY